MLFQKGGKIFIVPKDKYEREKYHISRGWSIIRDDPKDRCELILAIQRSRLHINEKVLGCKFNNY